MLPMIGWGYSDQDEKTSFSSHQSPSISQDQGGGEKNVTAAEDIQLDRMHPIISDAAMSVAPPPPPAVNVISPTEDQPVTIATVELTETVPCDEPPKSDVGMVTVDKEDPTEDEVINTDTSNDVM